MKMTFEINKEISDNIIDAHLMHGTWKVCAPYQNREIGTGDCLNVLAVKGAWLQALLFYFFYQTWPLTKYLSNTPSRGTWLATVPAFDDPSTDISEACVLFTVGSIRLRSSSGRHLSTSPWSLASPMRTSAGPSESSSARSLIADHDRSHSSAEG